MGIYKNWKGAVIELSPLRLFFLRLFGKRVEGIDDVRVVGYYWRGKLYITEVIE